LSAFVEEDRKEVQESADWHERVFRQSTWEKSASLLSRVRLCEYEDLRR
jgi:hypothetical protein